MEPILNPNLQRTISQTLYRLKLQFGVLVDIYRATSTETNFDTGVTSRTVVRRRVRRGIKMPEGIKRQQYISPYFTQTNKPFITKGNGWDEVTNVFVFDGKDLRDFDFEVQDWIVWNHERYEIAVVEELGSRAAWMVGTTRVKGEPAEEQFIELVEQTIDMEQETSEVVE